MSADPDPPERPAVPAAREDQAARGRAAKDRGAPTRRRRVGLFAIVAVFVLALDIVSKALVVANLPTTPIVKHVRVLGGLFYLQQTRNSGAAFSFGTGFTAILTVVALAVVVVIVRVAARLRSIGWAIALGLILGGAVGNLVDRLFRAPGVGQGHVVDWISVFGPDGEHWPIFNLADSGIVVGAIVAACLAFRGTEFDGRRARKSVKEEA